MRILIVEDEPSVSGFLTRALTEAGYDVECRVDGISGREAGVSGHHDLILLDVMLPGLDGFEVCRSIRQEGVVTPIIFLSARGSLNDKVRGLDVGADDYLPKPFQIPELLARVRANLRRPGAPLRLSAGTITLDPVARTVLVDGKELWMTPTEFALLEQLLRSTGRTMSRANLMRNVWKQDFIGDDKVLDVYISGLRKKLGEHGKLIRTDRGVGYRIEADRP